MTTITAASFLTHHVCQTVNPTANAPVRAIGRKRDFPIPSLGFAASVFPPHGAPDPTDPTFFVTRRNFTKPIQGVNVSSHAA